MTTEQTLLQRCETKCELCGSDSNPGVYEIPPVTNPGPDNSIMICDVCREQIENPENIDVNHWRCLNDSMWSQVPAVQIMAWRVLTRLSAEGWPQDLLEMLYLDDELLEWARANGDGQTGEEAAKHLDSNGALLEAGDIVTLIKDLDVKGVNFTAKRGTSVRGISLVADNPEHIEGRVNGQQIVILTKFVKKQSK